MTAPRTVLAVVCMFVAIWATDLLIHAGLMSADYGASKELWRPEADMMSHMGWMFLGQFLAATTMTLIYIRGFAQRRCLAEASFFGLLIGLFGQSFVPTFYAVQPLPEVICVKWMLFGSLQGVLLGMLLYAVCWPKRLPVTTDN